MPVAIFTPVNFLSISVPFFMDTWNLCWVIDSSDKLCGFYCEPSTTPRSHTSVAYKAECLITWVLSTPWHCIMCAWLLLWHYLCPVIPQLFQGAGRRGNKNHSVTESKLYQTSWSRCNFLQQGTGCPSVVLLGKLCSRLYRRPCKQSTRSSSGFVRILSFHRVETSGLTVCNCGSI
jgi:hypothetical protein